MAEDDYGEEFGDYFFDDDYLYIEDEYAIADELAEGQVPSPGYSGTNAELAMELYEWDNYDFWSDLAYGSDSYYDPESKIVRKRKTGDKPETPSHKRKRTSITTSITKDKRRRVTIKQETKSEHKGPDGQNVLFRKDQKPLAGPPTPESMESYSLFPDWRQRFAADTGDDFQAPMPEAMKKAAEGLDDDQDEPHEASPALDEKKPVRSRKHKAVRNVAMVEEEEEAPALDADTLRLILRQKLGDDMDESAFMTVIQDMLSGRGADDAAEQLTKVLLQGGDTASALSWLGQQGVNVDAGAEEEEETGSGRRVDSGAGLPADLQAESEATGHRKRKQKADPGSSSVETSPAKPRVTPSRSARKKAKA